MPFTNRGLALMCDWAFRRQETLPDRFYLALVTEQGGSPLASMAPTVATKLFDELNEIAAGNGYTIGGYALTPGATDFDAITEDDAREFAELSLKNISFIASGGDIPSSGDPAMYAVLLADEMSSPNVIANRPVIWYASLLTARTVLSGQTLQIVGLDIRIKGGSMINGDVQRGTITMASAASGTATLSPAVDITKAELRMIGQPRFTAGTPTAQEMSTTLVLTNGTTVTANRGSTVGTVVVSFEVTPNW